MGADDWLSAPLKGTAQRNWKKKKKFELSLN